MNISTSNYHIINSGVVVLPENEFLEFEIEGLRYRFIFTDEPAGDHKIQTNITGVLVNEGEGQYLSLNIINYNDLFATPSQPIEMGILQGKKLYVYFSVVTLSNQDKSKIKILNYTWYLSKEAVNGTAASK